MNARFTNIFAILAILTPATNLFAEGAGRTANGCSYSVVNGQYFSKCPPGQGLSTATRSELVAANSAPAAGIAKSTPTSAPAQVVSPTLPRDASDVSVVDANYSSVNSTTASARSSGGDYKPFYMQGFVGRSKAIMDSALASHGYSLGISAGTYLNDHIGAELGYDYANADTLLGLEKRSNGQIQSPLAAVGPLGSSANALLEDSTLANHLVHLDIHFYLTDLEALFRPYAGLGAGYRIAYLDENLPNGTRGSGGASLSQSSFGANLTAGLKVNVSESVHLAASLRYFLPVVNSDPEFQRGSTLNYFNMQDTNLTTAPLRQITASAAYVF